MSFSFTDVIKEAGIEDIDYIAKQVLADNDVTFCVTKVERQEVVNSQFAADEQWRLTILCTLSNMDKRKYFVSFPYEPKRRDPVIVACEQKLKELAQNGQEQIVHSLHVVAKTQTKYDRPYYKLEGLTQDGKPVCLCENIDTASK